MSDMKCPNIKIYKCSDGFATDNAQVAKSHEANIKSNKLICPFCQQELVRHWGMKEPALYCCDNPKCSRGGVATESSWQELIRTRKALDAAIRRLDQMTWGCDSSDAEHLLKEIKEITTQEQKD